jgi:hypothetical protein
MVGRNKTNPNSDTQTTASHLEKERMRDFFVDEALGMFWSFPILGFLA